MDRIMILASEFPPGPGGIGTHGYQLAKQFASYGKTVQAVAPQDYLSDEAIAQFNEDQPFSIVRLPSTTNKLAQAFNRLTKFLRAIKTFKPDLLIASGERSIWLAGIVLPFLKIPWVIVGHGSEFGIRNTLSTRITRLTANKANAIISVSQFTQRMVSKMGIKKPQSVTIHNGADEETFHTLSQDEIISFRKKESSSEKFIILTVGNVSDRKGQEVVIRALPEILQERPEVDYWIAGLPQKKAELTTLAEQLGVTDSIRFWGRVETEQLVKLYNACDLFVMTSRQLSDGDFEGYGIAVIEAALCRKPAVVSDNSGLVEAVIDGKTGLVVPQNDPKATARIILSLVNSQDELGRLAKNARENAISHQTWEIIGRRYLYLLENISLS
ncbi:glycosyltransferase family 4 protein [bacterium]|nr:glycosyltransferase family 4 protein [bacterium]